MRPEPHENGRCSMSRTEPDPGSNERHEYDLQYTVVKRTGSDIHQHRQSTSDDPLERIGEYEPRPSTVQSPPGRKAHGCGGTRRRASLIES